MSWVVTAYLLTQTIATILGGKFGDLFGRKSIFVGSIVLFTVASALAGLSQSMTWLIASRAIQGIGGGGLTVTATAMIADIIPLRDRGKYQGAIGAVFGATTVLGPLLGGFFTDHLSWQWVFYVNVPVARGDHCRWRSGCCRRCPRGPAPSSTPSASSSSRSARRG